MPPLALTDADVRAWTAERFYERGRRYFSDGRLQHLRRAGATLKGECIGSQPQPYRVEATLGEGPEQRIASARCSCPMGDGGRCKHAVALLLAWADDESAFTETATLAASLQRRDKDQLVALIEKMIDRHPDLERLARLSADADAALDEERLRQEVARTLPDLNSTPGRGGFPAPHAIADDLEDFLAVGDDYAEQGDLDSAACAHQILAEEIIEDYEGAFDHDGDISRVMNQCTDRLGTLLERSNDADASDALRRRLLRALFAIWRWDVDRGGYGLADAVPHLMLDHAMPAERRRVAGWVREALPDLDPADVDAGSDDASPFISVGFSSSWSPRDWKRERLARFLLALEESEGDTLDDEEYLTICRRGGLIEERVDRLLSLDRLEDALDAAVGDAANHELARLADRFVEYGAGEAIRARIEKRAAAEDAQPGRLTAWLRDYARDHGDDETALRLSKTIFWDRPSTDKYETVRAAAQAAGRWDAEQRAILERLEADGAFPLLTRLHLSDGQVQEALGTVHRAGTSPLAFGAGPGLKISVARAAEDEAPQAATDLYLEVACALIDARGRDNYAEAAEHLARIERIHKRQNDHAAWDDLIAMLRADNDNLPALQDELDKAGL